jgi:hypothetical protein
MNTHDEGKPAKHKQWTVMLYMAAAKDERTERAAMNDIKELEKVDIDDSKLNVLIQIDRQWPGYAERFRIEKGKGEKKGKSVPWKPLEVRVRNIPDKDGCYFADANLEASTNSGQPKALRDFVADARKEYPDDYFLLVLWGHAYGLGFGRDHGDPLTLKEIASSLDPKAPPLNAYIPTGRKPVDILGANACAMSYLEAAYELRHAAKFLVAPEIAMPFAGWPYEKILNEIVQTPGIEPEALGKKIVEEFVKSFRHQDVALTLLDLDQAQDLKTPLASLAAVLKEKIKFNKTGEPITDAFLDTAHGEVRPLIDLYDLCQKLDEIDDAEVKARALELRNKLEPADGPNKTPAERPSNTVEAVLSSAEIASQASESAIKPFVVFYDGDPNLEGLHGVGIYAPSLTGETTLTRLELDDKTYRELALMQDGNPWPELVYTELDRLLEPMNDAVLQLVKNTGATQPEDRTGVAQLLLSVDRSFLKLEAVLTKTQRSVETSVRSSLSSRLTADALPNKQRELTLAAARRLSRPYLRLAADFAETRYAGMSDTPPVFDIRSDGPVEDIAKALESLEDVAANVERTTRKVVTHSRLGLGDGLKVRMGKEGMGKEGMGKEGMGKEGMGKEGMGKEGMGKEGMGTLARLAATGIDFLAPDGGSTIELFGQAAAALKLMETAIAEVESDVQLILTNPPLGTNGDGEHYKRRSIEKVTMSFRALNGVVVNARETVFRILADPSQGLGPTSEQRSVGFDRQNLALAGGLSALGLSLL